MNDHEKRIYYDAFMRGVQYLMGQISQLDKGGKLTPVDQMAQDMIKSGNNYFLTKRIEKSDN